VTVIDAETGVQERLKSRPFRFIDSVAWLPDGKSLVCTASEGPRTSQVFVVQYPGGETRRVTSDLSGYEGVSLSSRGDTLAAIRRTDVTNIWVAPVEAGNDARALTSATGTSGSAREPEPLGKDAVAFMKWEGSTEGSGACGWMDREAARCPIRGSSSSASATRPRPESSSARSRTTHELHVWRVDPDGSNLRQLTKGKGETLTGPFS
jgi:Tol biopolymer transport system component